MKVRISRDKVLLSPEQLQVENPMNASLLDEEDADIASFKQERADVVQEHLNLLLDKRFEDAVARGEPDVIEDWKKQS